MKPITPKEVIKEKADSRPPEVFEVFNELIVRYWNGHESRFSQELVLELLTAKLDCDNDKIISNHWLDIEDAYRKAGWEVVYDSPGYNETFPASFCFTKG